MKHFLGYLQIAQYPQRQESYHIILYHVTQYFQVTKALNNYELMTWNDIEAYVYFGPFSS